MIFKIGGGFSNGAKLKYMISGTDRGRALNHNMGLDNRIRTDHYIGTDDGIRPHAHRRMQRSSGVNNGR